MAVEDLYYLTVRYIPAHFTLQNYQLMWAWMGMPKTLFTTLGISLLVAFCQTAATLRVRPVQISAPERAVYRVDRVYGRSARSDADAALPDFPGPAYDRHPLPFVLMGLICTGLKNGLYVFLLRQYFLGMPKELEEAAYVDGAGKIKVFLKIAMPMAIPAVVVSLIFSFVWNWNETINISLYNKDIQTLPMQLNIFVERYREMYPTTDGSEVNRLNESIRMAATLITIAPLIALYIALQKQFVESIEKTGITGE